MKDPVLLLIVLSCANAIMLICLLYGRPGKRMKILLILMTVLLVNGNTVTALIAALEGVFIITGAVILVSLLLVRASTVYRNRTIAPA